ncbi:MAG TPA: CotH kinase family protein [bacterium]|nr:CotH kinase family protein [bacterium]
MIRRFIFSSGILFSLAVTVWPRVVINEILYHAPDSDLEYIELLNTATAAVDLSNWIIQDDQEAHRFTLPLGIILPPGGYLVIANDPVLFQQAYGFAPDVSGIPFRFSNSGDAVRLFDSKKTLQEEVSYDDRPPWPEAADGLGASLERRNALLPAPLPGSWAPSSNHGTPGQANTAHTDTLPPLILEVDHSPKIPLPLQEITVTARVIDVDGEIESVQILYGWNRGTQFTATAMRDDGLLGDSIPGDGLYTARVEGAKALSLFRFAIQATDNDGHQSLVPPSGMEEPYMTVVEEAQPVEEVPYLRVVMRPEVQEKFLERYRTDDYFPATFYEDDTVYYSIQIRHRGRSRSANGRFKIRFPFNQLYRGGIRRLNLNGDDTNSLIKEQLSYPLYQDAGLPNLESEIVRVSINGSQARGTPYRSAVENPDGQFLRRKKYFTRDDGNLYKTTLDGTPQNKAVWHYAGDDPALYQDCYLKQTNEEEADYRDIIAFCKTLSEAEPWEPDYVDQVHSVLNVDDFLRWMAVSALCAHWDSPYTDHGHNYILYNNPATRQFHILAWDLNGTFNYSSNHDDLNYRKHYTHIRSTKFPAINKILNHPLFGAQYYREIDTLLQTLFTREEMNRRIEEVRRKMRLSTNAMSSYTTFVNQRIKDLSLWINRDQGAVFLSKPTYQARVGQPYLYRAAAVDYRKGQKMRYQLDAAPAWLRGDPDKGVLEGIPDQPGRFDVVLRAQSSSGVTLTQPYTLQVTDPRPRLLLTFNEANGKAIDLSEYGHQGTLIGDARRVAGRLGQAVYLDGQGDYVRVPHADSLSFSGAVTVEMWIKPDATSNNQVILSKGDADQFNYLLMLGYGPFSGDSSEPCFLPHRFDIENRVYYGRKEIEARLKGKIWVHLAGTYDSGRERVNVYVNNKRIVDSASRTLMPENTRDLLIGLNSGGFKGAIDDVKILPFAKEAFAAGLCLSQVDISGISSAQDRIALSLSALRPDPVNTGEYCVHFVKSNQWLLLPNVPLRPGQTVSWWLDELGLNISLPANETAALYPFASLGEPRAETILDQVTWGEEGASTDAPGVQAGIWLPGQSVPIPFSGPASCALKNFADNDEMARDWQAAPQQLAGPVITSLRIANGADATGQREVRIQIACEGHPREMRISDSPVFAPDWVLFQKEIDWTLPDGDGIKTIFVQVRDADRNRSAVASETIRLEANTAVEDWRAHR